MTDPHPLTLAFLARRPESAARVLQELEPGDAAAFLEGVPARLAGPTVAHMIPWSAARCLELLSPEHAAGVLRRLGYQDGTSLLRLIRRERREDILRHLPTKLARNLRSSLSYPRGTVGAWMDHGVPTFPHDAHVSDALRYARQRKDTSHSHVFVIGDNGRFAGAVSVGDLLRSDEKASLSQIMSSDVRTLSNRATLAAAAGLSDWDDYQMLPVVGRRGNVLGGLSRASLRRGFSKGKIVDNTVATNSILTHLLVAYLWTCANLIRLMMRPGRLGAHPSSEEIDRGGQRSQSR